MTSNQENKTYAINASALGIHDGLGSGADRISDGNNKAMKIAHVSAVVPPYWNGISHVLYQNTKYIVNKGYDIKVLTADTPLKDSSISKEINIIYLPVLFQVGNAPITLNLYKELVGFDIIHLHYPYIFGSSITTFASSKYRTPLLISYHSQLQEQHKLKNALFRVYNLLIEPFILKKADLILAVRKAHFKSLHPGASWDSKVIELPNGVDTNLFKPMDAREVRNALGLPQDSPVALFVGALDTAHRYKNVQLQLQSFYNLEIPDAHFLIVGDGNTRSYFENYAAKLGIQNRVHFLGKLPPEELPPIYNAADVLILPSYQPESFGMPLIEALACETAVISSDLPGVNEAVHDGVDGFLVPPGDGESLTRALREVLSDRERAKEMGRGGREKVVQKYSWQVIGEKLDQIYRSIL